MNIIKYAMNFIIAELCLSIACKFDDLTNNVARWHRNLDAGGDEKLKINFMWPQPCSLKFHGKKKIFVAVF